MIFSRRYFARGGWLDTTIPFYTEEMTVGAIAAQIDVPVHYRPALRVIHREHSTLGTELTPAKYLLERQGYRYLNRTVYGRRKVLRPGSQPQPPAVPLSLLRS